jgi:protein-L-isoaspartate(D-aspartate) O-methyltransferase
MREEFYSLEMLELLQLSPGMRVFELGAGSGWNAGLLGHLVGRTGYVETVEIIPLSRIDRGE